MLDQGKEEDYGIQRVDVEPLSLEELWANISDTVGKLERPEDNSAYHAACKELMEYLIAYASKLSGLKSERNKAAQAQYEAAISSLRNSLHGVIHRIIQEQIEPQSIEITETNFSNFLDLNLLRAAEFTYDPERKFTHTVELSDEDTNAFYEKSERLETILNREIKDPLTDGLAVIKEFQREKEVFTLDLDHRIDQLENSWAIKFWPEGFETVERKELNRLISLKTVQGTLTEAEREKNSLEARIKKLEKSFWASPLWPFATTEKAELNRLRALQTIERVNDQDLRNFIEQNIESMLKSLQINHETPEEFFKNLKNLEDFVETCGTAHPAHKIKLDPEHLNDLIEAQLMNAIADSVSDIEMNGGAGLTVYIENFDQVLTNVNRLINAVHGEGIINMHPAYSKQLLIDAINKNAAERLKTLFIDEIQADFDIKAVHALMIHLNEANTNFSFKAVPDSNFGKTVEHIKNAVKALFFNKLSKNESRECILADLEQSVNAMNTLSGEYPQLDLNFQNFIPEFVKETLIKLFRRELDIPVVSSDLSRLIKELREITDAYNEEFTELAEVCNSLIDEKLLEFIKMDISFENQTETSNFLMLRELLSNSVFDTEIKEALIESLQTQNKLTLEELEKPEPDFQALKDLMTYYEKLNSGFGRSENFKTEVDEQLRTFIGEINEYPEALKLTMLSLIEKSFPNEVQGSSAALRKMTNEQIGFLSEFSDAVNDDQLKGEVDLKNLLSVLDESKKLHSYLDASGLENAKCEALQNKIGVCDSIIENLRDQIESDDEALFLNFSMAEISLIEKINLSCGSGDEKAIDIILNNARNYFRKQLENPQNATPDILENLNKICILFRNFEQDTPYGFESFVSYVKMVREHAYEQYNTEQFKEVVHGFFRDYAASETSLDHFMKNLELFSGISKTPEAPGSFGDENAQRSYSTLLFNMIEKETRFDVLVEVREKYKKNFKLPDLFVFHTFQAMEDREQKLIGRDLDNESRGGWSKFFDKDIFEGMGTENQLRDVLRAVLTIIELLKNTSNSEYSKTYQHARAAILNKRLRNLENKLISDLNRLPEISNGAALITRMLFVMQFRKNIAEGLSDAGLEFLKFFEEGVTNNPDMMDLFLSLFNKGQLELFYELLPEQDSIIEVNENLLTKQIFLGFLESFVIRVVNDKMNGLLVNQPKLFEEQLQFLLEQYRRLSVLAGSEEEKKSLKNRSLEVLEGLKAEILEDSSINTRFQSGAIEVLQEQIEERISEQNETITNYKEMIALLNKDAKLAPDTKKQVIEEYQKQITNCEKEYLEKIKPIEMLISYQGAIDFLNDETKSFLNFLEGVLTQEMLAKFPNENANPLRSELKEAQDNRRQIKSFINKLNGSDQAQTVNSEDYTWTLSAEEPTGKNLKLNNIFFFYTEQGIGYALFDKKVPEKSITGEILLDQFKKLNDVQHIYNLRTFLKLPKDQQITEKFFSDDVLEQTSQKLIEYIVSNHLKRRMLTTNSRNLELFQSLLEPSENDVSCSDLEGRFNPGLCEELENTDETAVDCEVPENAGESAVSGMPGYSYKAGTANTLFQNKRGNEKPTTGKDNSSVPVPVPVPGAGIFK